jgi:hypothetical protein
VCQRHSGQNFVSFLAVATLSYRIFCGTGFAFPWEIANETWQFVEPQVELAKSKPNRNAGLTPANKRKK